MKLSITKESPHASIHAGYSSSTELHYITYLHMAICSLQETLLSLHQVLLLIQISQGKTGRLCAVSAPRAHQGQSRTEMVVRPCASGQQEQPHHAPRAATARSPRAWAVCSASQHPLQLPELVNKLQVDFRLEILQGCLDCKLAQ